MVTVSARSQIRRVGAALGASAAALGLAVGIGGGVAAHDDIESSDPPHLAVLDDPISSVDIDFGAEISDDVVMFLVFDVGDGTFDDIGGQTTRTGDTTARLDFPELDREGTYTVRYIAPVPADAHVIQGSISFTFGAPTGAAPDDPYLVSTSPPSRALLRAPVSSATLKFVDDVDDMRLRLLFDEGDGESFPELDATVEQVAPDTVRIDFAQLTRAGTYFVAYDGVGASTGEELAGSTSFSYLERSGAGTDDDGFPVVPFAIVAAVILALGATGTLFLARRAAGVDADGGDPSTDSDPDASSAALADSTG